MSPLVLVFLCANARIAGADSIGLAWDASPDSVSGYVVYVGSQPGAYAVIYDVGNHLAFTLPNAVPGQPYYFAVASYTPGPVVGPLSPEVVGYSDAPPTLVNPGNQTSTVGQQVALQLVGADPCGQAVSFSATGLPPGLKIASNGAISGAATTAGTYYVTATISDGTLTASETFAWTVMTSLPSGTTAPAVTTISSIQPNVVRHDAGVVTVTVTGTGFAPGIALEFRNGGGSAPRVLEVTGVSSTQFSAKVDVRSGGPPRDRRWDVRVTNRDGSTSTAAGLFQVTR